MEAILISLSILLSVLGSTTAALVYYHRLYGQFALNRLNAPKEVPILEGKLITENPPEKSGADSAAPKALRDKQLQVYSEIASLIGNIKSTLDYTTGEETLRQWKEAMMSPLREILRRSFEWALFLPGTLKDLPAQYASKVVRSLAQIDNVPPDQIEAYANIIASIRQTENEAARELQQKIRGELGI